MIVHLSGGVGVVFVVMNSKIWCNNVPFSSFSISGAICPSVAGFGFKLDGIVAFGGSERFATNLLDAQEADELVAILVDVIGGWIVENVIIDEIVFTAVIGEGGALLFWDVDLAVVGLLDCSSDGGVVDFDP